MRLNATDRATVEHVTADAIAAGPDAVDRAIAIHQERLTALRTRRGRLVAELARTERAIDMREMSVVLLHAGRDS